MDNLTKASKVSDSSTNAGIESTAMKVVAIWAGTIFGIKLSDLVLIATLIYTILQIGLVVSDRIVKPWLASRKKRIILLDEKINSGYGLENSPPDSVDPPNFKG